MDKKSIWDLSRPSAEQYRGMEKMRLTVVLDNVRSLNNIGSLFRTADAFMVERLALCGITATPPSPEISKTALGAENSVEWVYFDNTRDCIDKLKSEGYIVCCLEQVKGSVELGSFVPEPDRKYALVCGHEVYGVNPEIVNMADVWLEIPQGGTKHSLNVTVSTAIAMWQFFSHLRPDQIGQSADQQA